MNTLNTTTLAQVQLSQVIEQLKAMGDSSLQICHNNYCMEIGYEDIIYDNDEYTVNEQFDTPFDVLRNIQHYNLSDDYFYFHNGNLVSFNYLTAEDSPITFSELAQWIIDNDLFNDYDITVTTIGDILASIEDNITDDERLLNTACQYLHLKLLTLGNEYTADAKVSAVISCIVDFNYEQLDKMINDLNINYE